MVLDEDELDVTLAENVISSSLARQARRELQLLIQLTKSGRFPPASIMGIQPLSNIGETG
jgi:predicted RNA-binding protein associated with RNAse of E/G family